MLKQTDAKNDVRFLWKLFKPAETQLDLFGIDKLLCINLKAFFFY